MQRIRRLWILIAVIAILAVLPSYLRVYRVEGTSDAPSILTGDRVLLNKAAYDIRIPYTGIILKQRGNPRPGEVVMYRPPGDRIMVFKRVVACPGETIALRNNRIWIHGVPLEYEAVDRTLYDPVAMTNRLGVVIENESGHGATHLITYTPGAGTHDTFDPVTVPAGHYYFMGDNRDNSLDSRMYGPVPRDRIVGKVLVWN